MKIWLKYGSGTLGLELPRAVQVDVFEPRIAPFLENPVVTLQQALDVPLGCLPLEKRDAPGSVSIAVPDETRPVPVKLLLPPLLDRLLTIWPTLRPQDITIVVGGGLHPPADEAQQKRILPEDLRGCRVVAHDAEHSDTVSYGATSRGTPVEINAEYARAELKLVMGMVDAHQFVGFTGGAKGVTVGCASAAMIAANHRMLHENRAVAGNIADNPVRLDLNEAGEMAGVSMAINVVMDMAKRPVAVLAGNPSVVMREAACLTSELYGLSFSKPYDIVIASSGGLPKDICLYQAQKGLNAAMQCAAPGAGILLVAKCEQGIGDNVYYEYVRRFRCDADLKKDFENSEFRMGAHKAYLFARATTRFNVVVHMDIPETTLNECHLRSGKLQPTVDAWIRKNPKARVAVIKNANSSFFKRETTQCDACA